MPDPAAPRVRVVFEPVGRRADVRAGATVLDAARSAGVEMAGVCGGIGVCDSCRVRLLDGVLGPPTGQEAVAFDAAERAQGLRLACQATLGGDARIWVLPESLASAQRLQLEGEAGAVDGAPAVTGLDVRLGAPGLHDLRADASRLADALTARGLPPPLLSLPVLRQAAETLRAQGWAARVALREAAPEVVAVLPPGRRLCGLAVDVGSTKLAAYLADLESGERLAAAGAVNPQVAFGEDIVSRIASANRDEADRRRLTDALTAAVDALAGQLCAAAGVSREQVVDAVVAGNTVMHHFFAGLPVRSLGEAPFVPVTRDPLVVPARDVGLHLAPGAYAYLPPNVAGYVGADHVAMLTAVDFWETDDTVVALDIGTNTEISLASGGRRWSCSCASGPAFEGAHLRDGMRAAPGAIERVRWIDGRFHWHTVGGAPPVGLCGSGILDAVAAMRAAGVLDARGRLRDGAPGVRREGRDPACLLVPAAETGHGRDLVVTRADVHEIQLAKGAIRTGIDLLLGEAGLAAGDVDAFVVAGAFGTYLDLDSALRLGLFPALPRERFRQVGNAAGLGALQLLRSTARRRAAEAAATRITYVELTTHPRFHECFLEALFL